MQRFDYQNRNHWLLLILVVLLALRFAVVPWMTWQEELVAQNQRIYSQLSKGERLLTNQQRLQQDLIQVSAIEQKIQNTLLSSASSSTQFQVAFQQRIDALLSEYDIEVRNSNWLQPVNQGGVLEHQYEMSLKGDFKNLALFWVALEQQKPKISVREMTSVVSKMFPKSNRMGKFTGKFIVSVWQQEA